MDGFLCHENNLHPNVCVICFILPRILNVKTAYLTNEGLVPPGGRNTTFLCYYRFDKKDHNNYNRDFILIVINLYCIHTYK